MFGRHRRRGGHFGERGDDWRRMEEHEGRPDRGSGRGPMHSHHNRPGPPWMRRPHAHRGPFGFAPGGHPPFGRPFGPRGPFGGDPFDGDGGGRRRRRGDIKYVLLELLAEQPRHGYELIKELEQRDAGFYRPSPGSVYPTLQLLEEEGNLTSEMIGGKRVYTITEAGRSVLAERQQRPDGGPGRGRGGSRMELETLRDSTMALLNSVMEVGRHGTQDQQRAVLERINALRREIYGILAQDDQNRVI